MVQDSQRQRIEAAQADMLEQETSKRRVADFVRQSRPGYGTDDAAADSEKRLVADGWKRGAFGGYSRDTGYGTESFSVGGDRISYGYMPKQQPSVQGGGPNAAMMRQGTAGTGVNPGPVDDSIYSQMREVQGRIVDAEEAHRQVLNDGLLSAMRFAADTENNGRLPRSSCELLSRQFGMDGVRAGVLDAGYVPEDTTVMINGQKTAVKRGSFGITLAQKGQDGNMVYTPMFLSPSDVYAIMSANRSMFSDEQIAARRDVLLGMGYSSKELDALVEMNHFMNTSRGRAFQSRSRDFGMQDWDGMSEKERVARINAASREKQAQISADAKIAAAEARGAGRGTGAGVTRGTSVAGGQEKYNKDKYAALKERLDAIEYEEDEDGNRKKRVLDDNEKAVAAKIRSQMDAMLGIGGEAEQSENSAPPPQQRLVYYRDAQGNLKSGNGYVQGGRVYGADGRLIEGARETSPKLERMKEEQAKREAAKDKAAAGAGKKVAGAGKKVAGAGGAAPSVATGTSGDGTAQTAQLDADGKPLDWPKLPAAGQGTGGGDYDTPLTEEEERQFQEWRATLPKPLQYDGDYDLRGYWKDPDTQKMGIQDGAHFTDKYKKPNHPTFSNESQYATGENAKKAGRWDGDRFVPPQRTEPTSDANARKKELRRNNAEAVKEKRFQQFYKKFAIETEDGSITHTISEEEARKRFEREEEKLRKKREEQAENRRMAAELFKKTE